MSGHLDHGLEPEIDEAAWQRAFTSYIDNAVDPDSLDNWSGKMTVRDLAAHARSWADSAWTDHTRQED